MANVQVTFKHEDEVRGMAIGPVFVWDMDHPSNRQTEAGPTVAVEVPFGEPAPGCTELGWMTMADAYKVAESYGVELGES